MSRGSTECYVSSRNDLCRLIQRIGESSRVALDTEADSLHHYYEKVCLIQISLNGEHFIVDPLAGFDLDPLLQALAERHVIIHGADYDLRMLRQGFGFCARGVFDTMTAARLLGYEQIGLAALVECHFGVRLHKHGQRADWSRRPLPEDLIAYAYDDTRYLEALAQILEEELRQRGRLEWHREVCRELLATVANGSRPRDPEREWRIKGWHTLRSPRAQAILRELWLWRETQAQHADLPAFKIMSGELLIALSLWGDQHDMDPAAMPKMPRNCVGGRLKSLLRAVEHARSLPDSKWPKPLPPARRGPQPADAQLVHELRRVRDRLAVSLGVDPSLLASSAALSAIACTQPKNADEIKKAADFYHWQTELLGERFLEVISASNNGKG